MTTYATQTLSSLLNQSKLKKRVLFVDDSFLEIVRWTIGISSLIFDYGFDNIVRLEDAGKEEEKEKKEVEEKEREKEAKEVEEMLRGDEGW
eukprot:CAMPEP_0201519170 /NCGR_PEP_ID=MMETSP0161_2-20130828/9795_1 /ASSEMBLY_ACC=CAM_ASM_000251 /TAXON_ID=180227 /ORGANISM="Neoparamoeba aestuarina, Strain SoJaBio B1-5/56/2" /LENGTH=90 /DNA_ID=CAMNT_0047917123 /DNA_START=34 /DNA_END=303 /DNA_ORIENTATION=-